MHPSRRFYLLFVLLGLVSMAVAALTDLAQALTLLAIADLVLLSLAWWDGQQGKKERVQVTRLVIGALSIGRDNPINITVTNPRPQVQLQLKDDYPASFTATEELTATQSLGQGEHELLYQVQPHRRGQYDWGPLHLRQLNPWGLGWQQWSVGKPEKVEVYPDLIGLKALTIRLTQSSTGNLQQRRSLGLGTEFRELRDYQSGDDLRYLDWKASARRGMPLMRVLEPEREQTVIILLDRGRLMTAWVHGLQRFDWALNTSLAMAVAVLQRGDRLGIGVFDREVVCWLPPERGMHQLPKLLTALTPIQPVLREPDYLEAIGRLVDQQSRRALVVCLTDLIDATASRELLTALTQLTPRYLPFCVTMRDPQLDQLARTDAVNVQTAYQKAVAINLQQQRQLALAQLKQKGVLVLDAPADQVSEQLVDRYLQLKARTLL